MTSNKVRELSFFHFVEQKKCYKLIKEYFNTFVDCGENAHCMGEKTINWNLIFIKNSDISRNTSGIVLIFFSICRTQKYLQNDIKVNPLSLIVLEI